MYHVRGHLKLMQNFNLLQLLGIQMQDLLNCGDLGGNSSRRLDVQHFNCRLSCKGATWLYLRDSFQLIYSLLCYGAVMLYWHNMTESENQDVTRMLIYKGSLSAVTSYGN